MSHDDQNRETKRMLDQIEVVIEQQKSNLRELGLNKEQIERAIQPSLCFRDQLKEEADMSTTT